MRPAATLALVLAICGGAAQARDCAPDVALLLTPDGREQRVTVEIADEPAERALGLMNRSSLPPDHGMLFVYQRPQPASFWMKNTLIPLDLLYMDATGVVRHIHRKARPMDLTPLPGAAPGDTDPDRLMVLEIGGGEAARLDIAPGAILRHPRLPQDKAKAPCR